MADDVTLNLGTGGDVIGADEITGIKYQRVKLIQGANGVNDGDVSSAAPLQVTLANGTVPTHAVTLAAGATAIAKAEDAVSATADVGVPAMAIRKATPANTSDTDGDYEMLQMSAGRLWASATIDAALPAGTANIGDVDVLTVNGVAPAFGSGVRGATVQRVTIATDDVVPITDNAGSLTVDAPVGTPVFTRLSDGAAAIGVGNGTAASALRVTLPTDGTGVVTLTAGTNTNEVVGDIAHDTTAGGNPVSISGTSQANDDTAPPNRVNAESDTTRLATDYDGALYVRTHGPQVWSYHVNGSAALTDASVHAAPGAGLSLYVGTITFSSGAATAINMFLEEGATTVLGPYYLEAVAGRGMAVQFNPPRKITANTALTITTSAAIAHSVDITGFTGQG